MERRKKTKIDRLDGASSYTAGAGSGSSFGSSSGGSSGSSSSSGSVTFGTSSSGASQGGTAMGGADVSVTSNDNGGATTGQTSAPAATGTTTNSGSSRTGVGTMESEVVTIPTGDTVTMGDLVIAIKQYYHSEKVSEKDISRALSDPAFLDFLQKKIKNAKKNKVSLKKELATASEVQTEGESGQDNPQGNSDSWTWLGVTMKKAWWIFMGASVALLVLVLVIVALKTNKK